MFFHIPNLIYPGIVSAYNFRNQSLLAFFQKYMPNQNF